MTAQLMTSHVFNDTTVIQNEAPSLMTPHLMTGQVLNDTTGL